MFQTKAVVINTIFHIDFFYFCKQVQFSNELESLGKQTEKNATSEDPNTTLKGEVCN